MNGTEETVKRALEKRGFAVFRNGWPDFLCLKKSGRHAGPNALQYRGGRFDGMCAVEVKSSSDKLSEAQLLVHAILNIIGVPVYVLRPESVQAHDIETRAFWTRDDWCAARERLDELQGQIARAQQAADKMLAMLERSTWWTEPSPVPSTALDCLTKSDEIGRS